jgi:hypothetical protein
MTDEPHPTPGKPYTIESWYSEEFRKRWKVVRTDDCTDVLGQIITANEASGDCCLAVNGETKSLAFGPRGIRIVLRRR